MKPLFKGPHRPPASRGREPAGPSALGKPAGSRPRLADFVGWFVVLLALVAPAFAQDEAQEAVEEAAEAVEEAVDEVNMIQLNDQQVAQWVFGDRILMQGRTVQTYRGTIGDALQLQLDLLEAAAPLSETQRRKLDLAGRGDVDRFMDRFEAFARECPTGAVSQNKYIELNQKSQPLAKRYRAGLHGEGSLFRKVLRSTLGPEQLARFEALQAERDRKRYQALVKATVAMIDQKIPLTADQRKRLIEVTMAETTPPKAVVEGYYKYYVVLLQMSEIPEARIKPIFGDDEWPPFRNLTQQGRMARGQLLQVEEGEFDE